MILKIVQLIFFIIFKKKNWSFILTSDMCLYDINNKKGKLKLTIIFFRLNIFN